jgi:bifunctional enzyme CysN/CysC
MDETPLLRGRTYAMRIGTQSVPVTVTSIKHKIEIQSGLTKPATALQMNDIGLCNLATSVPIAFDPYEKSRAMGGFILIDRSTAATAGAGMISFGLRRAHNVKRQSFTIDKTMRAVMKAQKPCILWFTGLSGAGKSTILNLVEQRLARAGMHTYVLDGDNVRRGLNRDLGFTDADRVENIRRVGEVARLMVDAGLIVLCALISPFREERAMVRELVEAGEFVEIFVDAPLSLCMQRDPKGLYAKARQGLALHVTGLDSPYEPPADPDIRLDTSALTPEQAAEQVLGELARRGMIAPL